MPIDVFDCEQRVCSGPFYVISEVTGDVCKRMSWRREFIVEAGSECWASCNLNS